MALLTVALNSRIVIVTSRQMVFTIKIYNIYCMGGLEFVSPKNLRVSNRQEKPEGHSKTQAKKNQLPQKI